MLPNGFMMDGWLRKQVLMLKPQRSNKDLHGARLSENH